MKLCLHVVLWNEVEGQHGRASLVQLIIHGLDAVTSGGFEGRLTTASRGRGHRHC